MLNEEELLTAYIQELQDVDNLAALNNLRSKFLGKKGNIALASQQLSNLDIEQRKSLGQKINYLRERLSALLLEKSQEIEAKILASQLAKEKINLTIPGKVKQLGTVHPLSKALLEILGIFKCFGFRVISGPEIEDEKNNFDSLNISANHPARQMHDTFYLENGQLLRTHTSTVQIREMARHTPPFQLIAHGRVYRNDYDATHTPMFHQVEGMMVSSTVTISNLKFLMYEFMRLYFGSQYTVRFRPSYFPFTEPSAEIDIRSSEDSPWLEILGCGMIHPKVLNNVGIDPNKYQGFAFGIGVERCAMLKYHLKDLRQFFQSDINWLKAYSFSPFKLQIGEL